MGGFTPKKNPPGFFGYVPGWVNPDQKGMNRDERKSFYFSRNLL